jgi:23S rRNA (uracil1939-C5)-methyltransferase
MNYQQGNIVEIQISDLSNDGDGVGRIDGMVVFVPDTVTGDRASVRLIQVKSQYTRGKLHQLLTPSVDRIRPRCMVADKCGGCQWQHVSDEYQRTVKREQLVRALEKIGGFPQPEVAQMLFTPHSLNYRNKATYPLARSATTGQVQAGYYRTATHQLVNLNQCPVQDQRLNPFLTEIKKDIEARGWSIYNEKRHHGKLRHLSLRIGRHTGEILLTLIATDSHLSGIEEQAEIWMQRYSQLVGVCLNINAKQTNTIFGDRTDIIAGKGYLTEIFAGLKLQLRPETFFQVNTEAAEALLEEIVAQLNLQGNEILVDAYCGIGTFTLPLAKKVKSAIGIEVQQASIEQANINAKLNNINNVSFRSGTVESLLPQLEVRPDLVLLDPPRKGCDRSAIETLLKIQPQRIVYISCQPATLARDLKLLCQDGNYQLTLVQPADFFPQTAHVESIAFLLKS